MGPAVFRQLPKRRRSRDDLDATGRAFEVLPPELADADTIGVIYDEVDGLNFYNDYGMLRDLFANPGLAADRRYSDVLRGYLGSQTIGPLPFRRLAVALPEAASVVFQKVLRKPGFSWAEHGEALLLRRKPWVNIEQKIFVLHSFVSVTCGILKSGPRELRHSR